MTDCCLDRLFGIWGEGKILEIIFLKDCNVGITDGRDL
jgi:hypothetical protein